MPPRRRGSRTAGSTWTELVQQSATGVLANTIQGWKMEPGFQDPEQKICVNCFQFGHVKDNCKVVVTSSGNDFSENNSATDQGYTSVNATNCSSTTESICEPEMSSSSIQSSSFEEEYNDSFNTAKLKKELQQIKKEVEEMRFELKINLAKKVHCDFLHVVIKGIPVGVKQQDIINDLKSKDFSVDTVYRLNDQNNERTNQVVFQLPKDEDHIFYLSCCLGFEVYVDEYKNDFSLVRNNSVLTDENNDTDVKTPVNVLVRGIPLGVSKSDILKDLKKKYFHPMTVQSMMNPERKGNLEQVIVQVPNEEYYIKEVSCILGFPVTVNTDLNLAQCKLCLQFGHTIILCPGVKPNEVDNIVVSDNTDTLNVVIKGVPLEFDDENVLNNLTNIGFRPMAIHRMIVNEEMLPTYLVQVPENEKRILLLACFLGFSVKVEIFLPDLYEVEQCDKCKQFGHYSGNCQSENQALSWRNITNGVEKKKYSDNKEAINENYKHTTHNETTESVGKETTFTILNPTSLVSISTQTESLAPCINDKLDKLQETLKELLNRSNQKPQICNCRNSFEIPVPDAATSTHTSYVQKKELTQAVKLHQNIPNQSMKNMGSFEETVLNVHNAGKNFMESMGTCLVSTFRNFFVDDMINILKNNTSIMMEMPNPPGVTANTINEHLHLIEELEEIKRTIDGTLNQDYDANFPKFVDD